MMHHSPRRTLPPSTPPPAPSPPPSRAPCSPSCSNTTPRKTSTTAGCSRSSTPPRPSKTLLFSQFVTAAAAAAGARVNQYAAKNNTVDARGAGPLDLGQIVSQADPSLAVLHVRGCYLLLPSLCVRRLAPSLACCAALLWRVLRSLWRGWLLAAPSSSSHHDQ